VPGRKEYNRWCKVGRKRKGVTEKRREKGVSEGRRGKRKVENAAAESDGSTW